MRDRGRRLHGRVREVRHVEGRLDHLVRRRQGGLDVTFLADDLGVGARRPLEVPPEGRRVVDDVRAVIPVDLQLLAALLGRPRVGGDDRDAAQGVEHDRRLRLWDLHDLFDAGHLQRLAGIERLHLAVGDRAVLDHGVLHAGQPDVDSVRRLARHHVREVDAGHGLADVAEVLRVLERDGHDVRHREGGGRLHQLAVPERTARRHVDHAMVLPLALRRVHAPLLRRRLLQHRARHGAELAHAVVVVADAPRAVGVLVAVLLVADRLRDLDSAPVRLELVGEDHRDAGAHALAHLRAMGDDRHRSGGVDGDEQVRTQRGTDGGRSLSDGRERVESRERIELEREREGSGGGHALEEGSAADVLNGVHDFTPAASLMAARIRV